MSLTAFIRCLSGGMAGLRVLHGRSVRTPLTLTSGSTSVRRWQKSTQVPTSKVALQILKYVNFGYRSFPKTHLWFPLLAILPSNIEHVIIWKFCRKNLWHNSCTCIRFSFSRYYSSAVRKHYIPSGHYEYLQRCLFPGSDAWWSVLRQ